MNITDLRLDLATGIVYWASGHRAGREAGCKMGNGYRVITLERKMIYSHRIVWMLTYGEWPTRSIDHINGITDDNRPENLRESSPAEQMHNRALPKSNTSGVHGVTLHKQTGKWQASIKVHGKFIYLGIFDDLADAAHVRRNAEQQHGFHANHGRVSP